MFTISGAGEINRTQRHTRDSFSSGDLPPLPYLLSTREES